METRQTELALPSVRRHLCQEQVGIKIDTNLDIFVHLCLFFDSLHFWLKTPARTPAGAAIEIQTSKEHSDMG